MNDLEKQELQELVQHDCKQAINFLESHSLKVKDNKVEILFSDGEVDESKLDQQKFVNLWELQYEPSLIKVEFVIERPKEKHSNIRDLMESLLNKIVNQEFPVNPDESLDTSNICSHFKSIKINKISTGLKIILIGAICYCS